MHPWCDRPRYYPPGQHPATYLQREILRRLRELPRTSVVMEAMDYYEQSLAAFEGTESERKARDAAILAQGGPT